MYVYFRAKKGHYLSLPSVNNVNITFVSEELLPERELNFNYLKSWNPSLMMEETASEK